MALLAIYLPMLCSLRIPVRLGRRHNMPPPRDLSGGIIMDFNQNAENRCICQPEIQMYTNIFKFQTGVLCYVEI